MSDDSTKSNEDIKEPKIEIEAFNMTEDNLRLVLQMAQHTFSKRLLDKIFEDYGYKPIGLRNRH